jgi:hypothetical protein
MKKETQYAILGLAVAIAWVNLVITIAQWASSQG